MKIHEKECRKRGLRSNKYTKSLKNQNVAVLKRNDGILSLVDVLHCGYCGCKMVKEGRGISVTVDFISDDIGANGLVLIPLSDGTYEWKICMLTRKNEVPGNGVDLFQKRVKLQIDKILKGIITK